MQDWGEFAKRVLRAEMARKQVTYAKLVTLLADTGVRESEANLRNKISRGSFTAGFLFQCLAVMQVTTLHLDFS